MRKNDPDLCGGCGSNKPLHELRLLVETLERQEAQRKAKEGQQMLAALSRHVLGE